MSLSGPIAGAAAPLRTKVIWNPNANKGRCGRSWPQIRARLEAVLGPVDAAATPARGAAMALAREAFSQGCRRFVSVGGDGTLNEIVNGLIEDDRLLDPRLTFAQIPAGTSNVIARTMGHEGYGPLADSAFEALRGARTRPVDIFRTDIRSADGDAIVRYGFLFAMLGAPAVIGQRAAAVPLLKRLGPFAYILTAFATALTYKPRDVTLSIDGSTPTQLSSWAVMVCSSPGAGDGILLAPGADISDGRMDLVAVGNLTRKEALLEILPKLGDGSYCDHEKVNRVPVNDVDIATLGALPVDVDGEAAGFAPVRVRILPLQMQVAALR